MQPHSMPATQNSVNQQRVYPQLAEYMDARAAEFQVIASQRRAELEQVALYIQTCFGQSRAAKLTFICTHNSRRSHLSQLWAFYAAQYYNLPNVETYSGGTEATAFNPRAVAAMQRAGLNIVTKDETVSNPIYEVRSQGEAEPQVCFSKKYDASPNPNQGYCAVMTCSQADDACPLVTGCELRIAIRYEDPKIGDGTDSEAALYDERSRQICREMLYMMSKVSINA